MYMAWVKCNQLLPCKLSSSCFKSLPATTSTHGGHLHQKCNDYLGKQFQRHKAILPHPRFAHIVLNIAKPRLWENNMNAIMCVGTSPSTSLPPVFIHYALLERPTAHSTKFFKQESRQRFTLLYTNIYRS